MASVLRKRLAAARRRVVGHHRRHPCAPALALAPADAPWQPGFPSIPPTPPAQDQTGYAACPHAARKGHAETLRVLLSAGANPWLPDADGYTAYDYALDHAKPPAVVAALLEGDSRFAEVQRGFQVGWVEIASYANKRKGGGRQQGAAGRSGGSGAGGQGRRWVQR